jgi:hypothetical protein
MAVFTIKAPDGRKIKIKAADQETAIRGAKEWAAANPAARKLTGVVGKMDPAQAGVSDNVEQLTAPDSYKFNLDRIRRTYYPNLDDTQWQTAVNDPITNLKPADAGGLLSDGLTWGLSDEARGLSGALSPVTLGAGKDPIQAFKDFQAFEQSRRAAGAETAGPAGMAAQIGGAVLAGRPDMAAPKVAGLIPAIVQGGKQAAQQGAVAGFASAEGDLTDRARGALVGGATGLVIGSAVPATVGGVKKLISPSGGAPAAKLKSAAVLKKEGIDLTAGQATGNEKLMFREAELGGQAASDFASKQADQFTAAALKRIGAQADRATPDVLETAYDAIGKQFDNLASVTSTPFDNTLQNNLLQVAADYADTAGAPAPIVERMVNRLGELARNNGGRITGEVYKEVRSTLGRLAQRSDPATRMALRDLQNALDDAIERNVSGQTRKSWQAVRKQYQNFLVIEDAATRAGEDAADGIITPQALRGAAIRQNKRAFAKGASDFTELANAGVSAMPTLPNSGTTARAGARLFVPAGAATGATMGSMVGGPAGAVIGAGLGAVTPWAVGRGMLSNVGRRYLSNQAVGPVTDASSRFGSLLGRGLVPSLPTQGR